MSGLTIKDRTKYGCLEAHPNSNTLWFDGLPLNLQAIGRNQDIDPTLLSRIFSGEREVSVYYYKKIIKALSPVRKYTIDQLLELIEDRKAELAHANGSRNCKVKVS